MRKTASMSLVVAAVVSDLASAQIPGSEPLWVQNLSPIAANAALPSLRSAAVDEGISVSLNTAIASHWVRQQSSTGALFFDGETHRTALAVDYGLSSEWSVGLVLPWVSHDGGFLDAWVNDWHDAFGLSDGGRSQFPDDQLQYSLTDGVTQFSQSPQGSGIGDVQAELRYAYQRTAGQVAQLVLGLEAATGDEQQLRGSGSQDAYVALRFSGEHLSALPLTWHSQFGYSYSGGQELLGKAAREHNWFAAVGVDWRVAQRWSLLAQYDGHGAVADSTLDAIGASAALLSLGLRWHVQPEWQIDVNFVEDIAVETAPDITFQAALRWRPSR